MTLDRARPWFLGLALAATAGGCGSSNAAPPGGGPATSTADAAGDHLDGTRAAVAASPDAADASADGASLITPDLCAQKCQLMAQIDCPNAQTVDDCVSACLGVGSDCAAQRFAYYQCLLAQGAQALLCDTAHQAVVLKDGFCTQQNDDLFDCAAAL